jgi:Carboxypeptidase regulatory-like domain
MQSPRAVWSTLVLPLVLATSAYAQSSHLRGRVLDPAGEPLRYVDVQVLPGGPHATTNASGAFDLGPLAGGTYTVYARRLGFRPASVAVTVPAAAAAGFTITLQPLPVELDTIQTRLLEQQLPRLVRRMKLGLGAVEFGPDLMSKYPDMSVADILRYDGKLWVTLGGAETQVGPGDPCPTRVLIDGDSAGPTELDLLRKPDIAAIEVENSLDFINEPLIAARETISDGWPECTHLVMIWLNGYRQRPWGYSASKKGGGP